MYVCMILTFYNDGISTNSLFFETMMAVSFTIPKKNGRFVDHPTFLLSQIDCDLLCMIFDSLSLKKLKPERESFFHHSFESHFQ